jgi:hypothetical protein
MSKKYKFTAEKRILSLAVMLAAVALSLYASSNIDLLPPSIYGVCDRTVIIGDTVLYKDGVTAEDETDGKLKLYVDNSRVDPLEAGVYEVVYSAEDRSGNKASASALFTFVEPEPSPEQETKPYNNEYKPPFVPGFIRPDRFLNKPSADGPNERTHRLTRRPLALVLEEDYPLETMTEELASLCGNVLSEIISPEMEPYDKAYAIYYWVKAHMWYAKGDWHPDDWQTAAAAAFNTHNGNCYYYFSIAKALLQRAGLHTIDVKKTEYSWRSNHYWTLVWCETEEYGPGWYHFDTTPRINGRDFFLWTDKQMLDFSKQHGNCFDFDLALYPRTPGEPVE